MKRILRSLNIMEEWTLVLVLLGLAVLTSIQVFCRYVLNFSFTWMEELARYVGVFIAFLGASLGVKYGTHFSMDLVYEKVSNDRFRHGLQVVVCVLAAAIFVIVAYYGYVQTMKLKQFGAMTSVLRAPKYWAYLPVPIFSVIISIRFLILGVKHFVGLVRNDPFAFIKE